MIVILLFGFLAEQLTGYFLPDSATTVTMEQIDDRVEKEKEDKMEYDWCCAGVSVEMGPVAASGFGRHRALIAGLPTPDPPNPPPDI